MHLLQYSGYRLAYPLRRQMPRRPSAGRRIEWMVRNVERYNREQQGYGPGGLSGRLDVGAFERFLREHPWSDDAEFCRVCLRGLHVSMYGADLPEGRRVVEKSVENAGLARRFREMFPDCLFVHILRDPYATLVSIRKSMRSHGYPALRKVAGSIELSCRALLDNREALDGYLAVRYEDLLTDTEAVMRKVAEFLGLAWQPSLLAPTRLGEPWGGNSTSDTAFSGISTAPLHNWKKDILPLEIAVANRRLLPLFQPLGYERLPDPAAGLWRRGPGEGLGRYLANRLFLTAGR